MAPFEKWRIFLGLSAAVLSAIYDYRRSQTTSSQTKVGKAGLSKNGWSVSELLDRVPGQTGWSKKAIEQALQEVLEAVNRYQEKLAVGSVEALPNRETSGLYPLSMAREAKVRQWLVAHGDLPVDRGQELEIDQLSSQDLVDLYEQSKALVKTIDKWLATHSELVTFEYQTVEVKAGLLSKDFHLYHLVDRINTVYWMAVTVNARTLNKILSTTTFSDEEKIKQWREESLLDSIIDLLDDIADYTYKDSVANYHILHGSQGKERNTGDEAPSILVLRNNMSTMTTIEAAIRDWQSRYESLIDVSGDSFKLKAGAPMTEKYSLSKYLATISSELRKAVDKKRSAEKAIRSLDTFVTVFKDLYGEDLYGEELEVDKLYHDIVSALLGCQMALEEQRSEMMWIRGSAVEMMPVLTEWFARGKKATRFLNLDVPVGQITEPIVVIDSIDDLIAEGDDLSKEALFKQVDTFKSQKKLIIWLSQQSPKDLPTNDFSRLGLDRLLIILEGESHVPSF